MRFFNETHKLTRKFIVIFFALGGLTLTSMANAAMVVIGNPALPFKQLTKAQLGAIYLGKASSIKANITPYNQPSNTSVFETFYQQILGWGADQVSGYWSSQVFSGSGQEPPQVDNDQAAIQAVEEDPTAIAYVDTRSLNHVGNKVKVVYGHYKIPKLIKAPKKTNKSKAIYKSSSTNGFMTALDNPINSSSADANPDAALATQLSNINTMSSEDNTSGDIWQSLASHMQLQDQINNPDVQHWIKWFTSHKNVLNTMIDNATPYLYYVYHQTERRHMPAEFALLPMIESGYNPRALSSKSAAGLWQLMPGTASSFGMEMNWWYDPRRDIMTSTRAGLNYLEDLHRQMGTWFLAAAAYNEGPGALHAAIHRAKLAGKPTDYWNLAMPQETKQYVPKLLAISAIIANPAKYGIQLPVVPNHPFFGSVTLTSQMDLQEISAFSGLSIAGIKALNPGIQRWATAPQGHFTLLLPLITINKFESNLNKVAGQPHTAWKFAKITGDDSIQTLAQQAGVTPEYLKSVNRIKGKLRTGSGILVPVLNGATFSAIKEVNGAKQMTQSNQENLMSSALDRATKSQAEGLPAEVTGEPIKADDNIESLVGKLYG